MEYFVGVDEAGRGPIAGPVAVGVVMVPAGFNIQKHFPGVADSKKLTPKKREALYQLLQKNKTLRYIVVFASANVIDKIGITKAVRQCVWKGVKKLSPKTAGVKVLLDGLLVAPPEYTQKTIIRGDATEPIISLASISAKVLRDRQMVRFVKKFPGYGFEVHKGYGTKAHYQAIHRLGACPLHRTTYL